MSLVPGRRVRVSCTKRCAKQPHACQVITRRLPPDHRLCERRIGTVFVRYIARTQVHRPPGGVVVFWCGGAAGAIHQTM